MLNQEFQQIEGLGAEHNLPPALYERARSGIEFIIRKSN
jgi:hypothetical protein